MNTISFLKRFWRRYYSLITKRRDLALHITFFFAMVIVLCLIPFLSYLGF